MSFPARTPPRFSHRLVVGAIVLAGVGLSLMLYREGRAAERARAETEFVHWATLRHGLTRQILGHYEDALFGLSALFMFNPGLTAREFAQATQRFDERLAGVQAHEWVPLVDGRHRAAFEARMAREHAPRRYAIVERTGAGSVRLAAEQSYYYPIAYLEPMAGNELATGVDLRSGPTGESVELARRTREMVVSQPLRLIQETGDQPGVVMILPVYRPEGGRPGPEGGEPEDRFIGFLQAVFRVHDLLETAQAAQPQAMVDMLFLDYSETDPARRTLYHRPARDDVARTPVPEAEFRRGLYRELKLRFGQRDWRVVFRPAAGWLEQQYTWTPLVRSLGLLALSGLAAGMVHLVGRRTETVRRLVEQRTAELAESRRQFANTLHALPGMAYRCRYDEQLTVLFVSEGVKGLTGWSAEEVVGGAVHFRDCIHPDDLPRVREATRAALHARDDVEVEYRLRTRDGQEKWVLSRGRGTYSPAGALEIFEGLAIDITAQKSAELARLALERRLLEGQKLESLGLLAGGIAHDFNNLLSSIVGNVGLARHALPPASEADAHLRAIEVASLRAAELCHQMLAYAGKGRFFIEPIDLTALTEELLALLRISTAHQAALQLELARQVPPVLADATQLRQIVMNLVLNAADAIGLAGRSDGLITLTTGVRRADVALLSGCVAGADLPEGEYVFVEVKDNGVGMTAEVMGKIFDPFFTTKFAGRGLGLAAVLGIVRGHKGALCVTSRPGEGSTFCLLLPPAPARTPLPATPAMIDSERWRHEGNILVIEDEEPVRVVTMEILKTFGFSARGAADGPAGLALFRENPDAIDLVLLDLLMPGMSGEETLRQLRALKPGVRVLLMSGYNEGDLLQRLASEGPLGFIAKPFTRAALERRLRDMLK